jgi:hypothetical protein
MSSRKLKFWLRSRRMRLNSSIKSKRNSDLQVMLRELIFSKITLKNPTKRPIKWKMNLKHWSENGMLNLKRQARELISFLIRPLKEESLTNWVKNWRVSKEIFRHFYQKRLSLKDLCKTASLHWKIVNCKI